MSPVKNRRPQFSQIASDVLEPRESVLGYVKVGGKDPKIRYARNTGRPWVAPSRYVEPVRFEVTTREKVNKEVEGQGKARGQKFKVDLGYVRDDAFHKKVGKENPSEISVRFMFPEWQQNLVSFFGCHDGSQWVCTGDGHQAKDVKRGEVPCTCPRLKQHEGEYPKELMPQERKLLKCKPHATLSLILPEADMYGGFWEFKTGSWETTANIRTQLQLFQEQFGRLDGIPFVLKVFPATKRFGEGDESGVTTQPIVTVLLRESFDTARQIAAAAVQDAQKFLLPGMPDPGRHTEVVLQEMEEEVESVGGEFYHENQPEGETPHTPPAAPDGSEPEPEEKEFEEGDWEEEGEEGEDVPEPDPEPSGPTLAESEETARQILEKVGWEPQAINSRIEYHRATGEWALLLDRLKTGFPEQWTEVTGEVLEEPVTEPQDELPL